MHIVEPYITEEIPPSPYVPEYFEALGGRIAYLETSRGCPFSCAFCLSGRCGGVRYYPMERAREEVLLLANSGTATVKFVDRTFNANRDRARGLMAFIVSEYGKRIPMGVCFHFEIAGDLLDEATLALFAEAPAGLFQVEIGLQSFHEETLAAVCRKTDTEKLTRAVRHLLSSNTVHVHVDLIAGLPQEDMATLLSGFERAYRLQPHQLQLGFLKRLHGSPMADEPQRYPATFSDTAPYEVRSTPWLSAAELSRLHVLENALDRVYNSRRFPRTLRYLTDTVGLSPVTVFEAVGNRLGTQPPQLDALTALLWELFSAHPQVSAGDLRDAMVCDRMATTPAAVLPAFLDTDPQERRRLKRLLDTDPRLRRPADVRRGTALLGDGTLVYADHHRPHPVTGEYDLGYFREEHLGRERRFLLFDLDGTLTDPALGITNSVQYALRRFGVEEPDRTKLYPFIGPPLTESFRKYYGWSEEQAHAGLLAYREYFSAAGIYENEVYEGIPALLHDARRAGYRVIMATSKPEMYAHRLMQHFGLSEYFTCIAGADMAETRVAKTDVIRYAMARAGIVPAEAVMVGDRRFDVEGGRALGMYTVGVLFGYGGRDELESAGADVLAETVAELRRILLT